MKKQFKSLLFQQKKKIVFLYCLMHSEMSKAFAARLRSRGRPAWAWWLLDDENNAAAIAMVAKVIYEYFIFF
jgi:hypothetical protein